MVNKQYLIPLSQGQYAIVDRDDQVALSQYKWYAFWDADTKSFRAARQYPSGIPRRRINVVMARQIMDAPAGMQVDHINHNTLDNRRHNLRVCTSAQNNCNRRMRSDNTSGVKGVSRINGKWRASIGHNGKWIHLGSYTDKDAAIKARRLAENRLHGS